MNHVVAYQLLSDELNAYRVLSFADLAPLVGEQSQRIIQKDGVDYSVDIAVTRPPQSNDILVNGSIGDANWGSPHDQLEDTIIIPPPAEPTSP
jgi:hypothetical protein